MLTQASTYPVVNPTTLVDGRIRQVLSGPDSKWDEVVPSINFKTAVILSSSFSMIAGAATAAVLSKKGKRVKGALVYGLGGASVGAIASFLILKRI